MNIQLRPITSIHPYERNPRHNDDAIDAVTQSLKEYGWQQPIVVDEAGVIVAGHTRYKAALKLGMSEVPVHVASGLSPEQLQAYRLADNKSSDLSDWNYELLSVELENLQQANYDLGLLGFNQAELANLLQHGQPNGLCDEDEVPAPPDAAVTQPGDLWILGDHRLLCGDSALRADCTKLMDGASIHMLNTDPPYNVKVEPASAGSIQGGTRPLRASWRSLEHQREQGVKPKATKINKNDKKTRAKARPLMNDYLPDDQFAEAILAWFSNAAHFMLPGSTYYIWGGFANIYNYPNAILKAGLYFSQTIIWVKNHPVINRKDFMTDHEWAFYGWREGAAHRFYGPNNVADVWQVKKVHGTKMVHLTEKPVELAARAITYGTQPGENVLDLFGGSGSTMIAAQQTGRKAFLMELDPLYCDVIVQRFIKFTGKPVQCLDRGGNPSTRADDITATKVE